MDLKKYYHIGKVFFNKMPSYLIFFVTARCNSRCRMCFYWKNIENPQKELSLEEIKKISKGFGHLQYLTVSGGEPFLRTDLSEIIQTFVKQNNLQFVSIPTNGLLPDRIASVSEDMFKKCPNTFFRIALSLDGIGQDHDEIRGIPGNFEKLKESYARLNELRKKYGNFNIDSTTVFTNFNHRKIKGIFEWVDKNINIDNHVLLLARGNARESIAKQVSIDEYAEMADYVEQKTFAKSPRKKQFYLKALKAVKLVMRDVIVRTVKEKKMILPCVAGKKMVIISETGKVYPCELLPKEMGDLRKNNYDIKKILFSQAGKDIKRQIKETKCHCTFECAIQNNIFYNPLAYPSIIKKLFRLK
ncbi:MAG: radical SAM protein [Candidatus Niyogibacteria bacterium]|nr:radical SAM protein [Candidatus Niyogibacteria bacterium]